MTDGVHIEGTAELQRFANALKEAGDRDLQKQVSAAMRREVKPLGDRIIREGAAKMPHRGGLAARIASRGSVGISNSLAGRSASVTLRLKTKDGYDLRGLERGELRHPVFGNPRAWVRQSVSPHAFSDVFEREAPKVRDAVLNAAQGVLNDVARKA